MKVGIDSYCFHRYFGEVYPGLETPPERELTLFGMVDRVKGAGAEGLAIESFMLGYTDPSALRDRLDAAELHRIWAWGHPRGLGSGQTPEALEDLRQHAVIARTVGADVMRICAGGRSTRTLSWMEHRALLLPLLQEAADFAGEQGVALAIENHIDLSTDEMLDLVDTLNHPMLGICLDTANQLRMFEDPVVAAQRMAPHVRAVHFKDITAYKGDPKTFGFWPSVPIGKGLIDFPEILRALRAADFDGLLAMEIDYLHPAYGQEIDVIPGGIETMRTLVASVRP